MTLTQVNYFLTVIESGSISAASKKLFVSQPAVSKQISNFESELGVTLFDRTNHRNFLTQQGKMLYNALCNSRAEINDTVNIIRCGTQENRVFKQEQTPDNLPDRAGNAYHILSDVIPDTISDSTMAECSEALCMDDCISRLLLYAVSETGTLYRLGQCFSQLKGNNCQNKNHTIKSIHGSVRELLEFAMEYGIDGNIWQGYLTFLLIKNENPFSLACERRKAPINSLEYLAKADFGIFRRLFNYDFSKIESELKTGCFSAILNFTSPIANGVAVGSKKIIGKNISSLSKKLGACRNVDEFHRLITGYYEQYGVGEPGMYGAFRIRSVGGEAHPVPVSFADYSTLGNLIGYEEQKRRLRVNTEAFLSGKPANNVLLYGDAGTGKSTSVKALVGDYYCRGLRMIELYKNQFCELPNIIAAVKSRNYRFIIFIDDLSFEENEVEYKALKAVIEGGIEAMPGNVLIYATSNRRHLIRETWNDRSDMQHENDVHRSDTIEEKLSLSARFGVQIYYSNLNPTQFQDMVLEMAHRQHIDIPDEILLAESNKWELRHPGHSGRTAQQFINYITVTVPPGSP